VINESYRLDRKRRIIEIQGLCREPAIEAWNKIENCESEESIANELGYPTHYFFKLISDEFSNRLSVGISFLEFPKMTEALENYCWRMVCRNDYFIFAEKINSSTCVQLRSKLRRLHNQGTPISEISHAYEIDTKKVKSLVMLAMAEEGLTLDEIGIQFSVTGERARRLIDNLGISIRDLRNQQNINKNQNAAELTDAIKNWVIAHPGCFLSEVAAGLNLLESEVQKLCPTACRKLVLGSSRKKLSENYTKYFRYQILEALRSAYSLRNPSMSMYSVNETQPISGTYYEKLRLSGSIYGPSQARIIQIFGTWKNACDEAGVPSIESFRKNYNLRWSHDDLILQLAEFILSDFSPSAEGFDEWSKRSEDRCSSGTIRNQLGSWSKSYELGLIHLRRRWLGENSDI
jgi:hypothetical protein